MIHSPGLIHTSSLPEPGPSTPLTLGTHSRRTLNTRVPTDPSRPYLSTQRRPLGRGLGRRADALSVKLLLRDLDALMNAIFHNLRPRASGKTPHQYSRRTEPEADPAGPVRT